MLADIASGHSDAADILFLVAAILAVVAAWSAWPEQKMTSTVGWLAVAALAVAWLVA